jgi:hypothetical protein
MRQTSYLLAGTFAACFAFSGVHAETTVLVKSGSWEAFGGTTDKGTPVCGISSSPEKKYFGLKQFADRDTFTIQISDKSWSIKDKSKYAVSMRLDRNKLWTANASGMHFSDGDPGLEYDIRRTELRKFNKEFGSSDKLKLMFANGMETWNLDLAIARKVSAEFAACIGKIK